MHSTKTPRRNVAMTTYLMTTSHLIQENMLLFMRKLTTLVVVNPNRKVVVATTVTAAAVTVTAAAVTAAAVTAAAVATVAAAS